MESTSKIEHATPSASSPYTRVPWSFQRTSSKGNKIVAVLGAQWGDEGKGKLVDGLAAMADVCCRFNGGSNAGHTLVVEGRKIAMHLTPCGILHPKCDNLLGNGVVIHLKTLLEEIKLIGQTIPNAMSRLFISSRAHLLLDVHQIVDGQQEALKSKSGTSLGTTGRGIGPCYSSKASRIGIRIADLKDWTFFEQKFRRIVAHYRKLYDLSKYDEEDELARHKIYVQTISPQVVDGVSWLHRRAQKGDSILVEGANAALLDIDFGTYPFVTSSSTTAGGICIGLGLPPSSIRAVVGVVKAYTTRVGEGPFMTELKDELGQKLQSVGREIGVSTGRPRRCGWLDVPLITYSNLLNGFDAINLTKVDVLSGIMPLKICVAYKNRSGELMDTEAQPASVAEAADFTPEYETLSGWKEDLSDCKTYDELPEGAKVYIQRIEELIGVPIVWIGVGPDRTSTIFKPSAAFV